LNVDKKLNDLDVDNKASRLDSIFRRLPSQTEARLKSSDVEVQLRMDKVERLHSALGSSWAAVETAFDELKLRVAHGLGGEPFNIGSQQSSPDKSKLSLRREERDESSDPWAEAARERRKGEASQKQSKANGWGK